MTGFMSTYSAALWTSVFVLLYIAYRAALPKPLPNIPYNHDAAKKLLGDVPEMMSYVRRTRRIFCWLTSLTDRHNSPIVQVFIKPFSLPWVIITDPLESQDILLRRSREFDRSPMLGEFAGGLMPEQHSHHLSNDALFRRNRALINRKYHSCPATVARSLSLGMFQNRPATPREARSKWLTCISDLMAPTFIREVSAPEMYRAAQEMICVWGVKCDKAGGRPFPAHHDLTYLALDAILAAVFGPSDEANVTSRRLSEIQGWGAGAGPTGGDDEAVPFPESEGIVPPISAAVITLAMSLSDNQLSPVPALTSWVMRKLPYMRRAMAVKDEYIRRKVDECVPLVEAADRDDDDGDGDDGPRASSSPPPQPRSALHSVLLREREAASREGRGPEYHGRAISDEFFGFLMAGHDTTATTMAWTVKLLADAGPAAQARLRGELHAALPAAAGRAPTCTELAAARAPYLDAVVEEALRHANPIAFVARRAVADAEVLGRRVPRGTDVFLMANGAGYLAPNMAVGDNLRSPGAAPGAKGLTGLWEDGDIADFRPERWLRTAGDGAEVVFDPMAGPSLPFGAGPRGCFGKRLALQALRIQIALVVWHFELGRCPPELSSYDSVQKFAREPTQCYVRLSKVQW